MLGYSFGKFDILREKDLQELDETIQRIAEDGNEYFALGVYDDELCKALNLGTPLKTVEERMKIVSQLTGVDFAFSIPSMDPELIKSRALEEFKKFIELEEARKRDGREPKPKKYRLGYVPGTYDLFHCGHLENLLEAAANCDRVIVGVKSDSLVMEQKGVRPTITATERMEILRHFKFVDGVYQYFVRDPHIALSYIEERYRERVDAIFLGSDLKKDFFKDIDDLNIVFTDRDEEAMQSRSSSFYRKRLNILRGTNVAARESRGTMPIGSIDDNKCYEENDSGAEITD